MAEQQNDTNPKNPQQNTQQKPQDLNQILKVRREKLKALQDEGRFTELMVRQEELKTLPFGEIWDEYCRRCGKPADGEWFPLVEEYEKKVLVNRT